MKRAAVEQIRTARQTSEEACWQCGRPATETCSGIGIGIGSATETCSCTLTGILIGFTFGVGVGIGIGSEGGLLLRPVSNIEFCNKHGFLHILVM